LFRVLEAVDAKRLAEMDWLTVWRAGSLKFYVHAGKANPPKGVMLWQTVNVGRLMK
jgi:hypothetical protein